MEPARPRAGNDRDEGVRLQLLLPPARQIRAEIKKIHIF